MECLPHSTWAYNGSMRYFSRGITELTGCILDEPGECIQEKCQKARTIKYQLSGLKVLFLQLSQQIPF